MASLDTSQSHEPWNKGKLIGQKAPLKLKDIWAIRIRLQLGQKVRDLALFNLAIDSKLRACDLVKLRVSDVSHGGQMASRAMVMQQKTGRPVQLESGSFYAATLTSSLRPLTFVGCIPTKPISRYQARLNSSLDTSG